jgi:pimeloyl-ACP methyl ester carboxylesterase
MLALALLAAISWQPYELPPQAGPLRAQLGKLTVPLNRAKGTGTAELAFVRLQNGGKGAPIVYLAGGPGSSGSGVARNPYALPSLAKLAAIGDVILFDQRGTGLSTPRPVCAPIPREPGETVPVEQYVKNARACVDEWTAKGVDVSAFNNVESAADVDALRKALGVPKLSLLGFSYGTHLGLTVIRNHGDGVERAVLIGTAGPNHMRKLPWMLDTQLAKLSLLAGQDMTAMTKRVLAKLDREPMLVTVTDRARKKDVRIPVDDDLLRGFLVADVGDGNDFIVFPALLETIERGDPSILEWFAEKRYNQGAASGVNLMLLGMRCSAGATADRDREIARQAGTSIFLNVVNNIFPAACAVLPVPDHGDAYRAPLISNAHVLFVSGTLDAHTPPYQAEEVRWGMPNARHLIVQNAGHEDMEPSEAVQAVIADYFAGKDVSSRSVALPSPRFRTVEEAKQERKR